eukprot:933630-Pleurochrysis_carterae.AAC.1
MAHDPSAYGVNGGTAAAVTNSTAQFVQRRLRDADKHDSLVRRRRKHVRVFCHMHKAVALRAIPT